MNCTLIVIMIISKTNQSSEKRLLRKLYDGGMPLEPGYHKVREIIIIVELIITIVVVTIGSMYYS